MKIQPLGEQIIIDPVELNDDGEYEIIEDEGTASTGAFRAEGKETDSGIVVPRTEDDSDLLVAKVIESGEYGYNGTEMSVSKGDMIVYNEKANVNKIVISGMEFLFIRERDVYAILKENEEDK